MMDELVFQYLTNEEALEAAREKNESVTVYENLHNGSELIAYPNGCLIGFGRDGDGFCYSHQTFHDE